MRHKRRPQMPQIDRRSQIYGDTNRRDRKHEHITPKEIFVDHLKSCSAFVNMQGFSDISTVFGRDGILRPKRTRYIGRKFASCFWRYVDTVTDGGAIVELPEDNDYNNVIALKMLWVPEVWGKQGIAGRCVRDILKIVDSANLICAEEDKKYKEKMVTGNNFQIVVVPNPFWAKDWSLTDDGTIDWSDSCAATRNVIDESKKELPKDKQRVRWQKLREFYMRFGFKEMDDCWWEDYYSEEHHQIKKRRTMSSRSEEIGRKALTYG